MSAWQGEGTEIGGKVIAFIAVAAVLALVVGFAVGTFLGRSSAPDLATLAGQAHAAAGDLQRTLAPAKAKYDASAPDGKVEDATGYTAAQGLIQKVRARLAAQHATFEALAAGAFARATAALAELQRKATVPVPAAEFDAAFAEADAALAVLAGR
jgi:hypothetical protein